MSNPTVYIGSSVRYTASYHRVADCRHLQANNNGYREVKRDEVEPQHDPCQGPDCWGVAPDTTSTCPLCGEEVAGTRRPEHIARCASGEEVVGDD